MKYAPQPWDLHVSMHVPAAGSLKLALLMGSGIWSRDGFAWETRHIAYFIKIKSTLPVISEGYTIRRAHDVDIFSKCWINEYCRCYSIVLRFIIFKNGCSDSFSTNNYYIFSTNFKSNQIYLQWLSSPVDALDDKPFSSVSSFFGLRLQTKFWKKQVLGTLWPEISLLFVTGHRIRPC